jgi:hypothetical protein
MCNVRFMVVVDVAGNRGSGWSADGSGGRLGLTSVRFVDKDEMILEIRYATINYGSLARFTGHHLMLPPSLLTWASSLSSPSSSIPLAATSASARS